MQLSSKLEDRVNSRDQSHSLWLWPRWCYYNAVSSTVVARSLSTMSSPKSFVDVGRGWRSQSSATQRRRGWWLVDITERLRQPCLDRTFSCRSVQRAVDVDAHASATDLTLATSSSLSHGLTYQLQQLSVISSAFTAWTALSTYW